jgi:DNA-3-methyladenine glycosylase
VPGSAELFELLGRASVEVAPRLLGLRLSHTTPQGTVSVELTEVEAYSGESDPASHAFRGPTARNQVMFGPAGRLYVYFSYGMHWCANVVTGPDGVASAVLMRAGRVVEGAELARTRRGDRVADRSLARGPACLTQALGIGREQNGTLLLDGGPLALATGPGGVEPVRIRSGPRVGVSRAADVAHRFWVDGDETVSAYRRSTRSVPSVAEEGSSVGGC